MLKLSVFLRAVRSRPTSLRTCYFVAGAELSKRDDYASHSLVVVDCHRHLGARLESRGDHVGKGNDHETFGDDHIPPSDNLTKLGSSDSGYDEQDSPF